MAAITTQPSKAPEGTSNDVLKNGAPEGDEDLPEGLKDLISLESVTIHQHLESTAGIHSFIYRSP